MVVKVQVALVNFWRFNGLLCASLFFLFIYKWKHVYFFENFFFPFLVQKECIGLKGHAGESLTCAGQILMILWPVMCITFLLIYIYKWKHVFCFEKFYFLFLVQKEPIGLKDHIGESLSYAGQILAILWPLLWKFSYCLYTNSIWMLWKLVLRKRKGVILLRVYIGVEVNGMTLTLTLWPWDDLSRS